MNAINVIQPYRKYGMWVFDDPKVGLSEEPFVGGADDLIDRVTAHIPDAADGFVMVFSAQAFPGSQHRLVWSHADGTGNVYAAPDLGAEGWLCPALLKYFDAPPSEIFVQIRPAG